MKSININGVEYAINAKIEDFTIRSMPSSNVAFYGVNSDQKQLFVQFKNGSSFLYSEIDSQTAIDLINCESIGKFVSSRIVKHFPSEKLEAIMITPIVKEIFTENSEVPYLSTAVNDQDLEEPQF